MCNHLQGILGMFFHSVNVPQSVIEVLVHAGLSISIMSIHHAVTLMSVDSVQKIKDGLHTLKVAMVYDNFDIKMLEPIIAHGSLFVSATSATAIPLVEVENINMLCCSAALWQIDHCNPSPSASPTTFDEFNLLRFHVKDKYNH